MAAAAAVEDSMAGEDCWSPVAFAFVAAATFACAAVAGLVFVAGVAAATFAAGVEDSSYL